MDRICRECGAPLTGRSDKKFCSDGCRTSWHNRRYCEMLGKAAAVNRILMRNRRLLEAVYNKGIRRIGLTDRSMAGFDIRYYTSVNKPPLRAMVYHCYEFSYVLSCGRLCRLTKTT
jgi:hypothetical protein